MIDYRVFNPRIKPMFPATELDFLKYRTPLFLMLVLNNPMRLMPAPELNEEVA